MRGSNMLCVILIIATFSLNALSQNDTIAKIDLIKSYFQKLTSQGGTWIAKNKDFQSNNSYGFPKFIMRFWEYDDMSIRGEILGINVKNDTIKFWEIWDFIDVTSVKSIQVQRGPTGNYGIGNSSYESDILRLGEINFRYTDGSEMKHRSSHQFITKYQLKSISEDFDSDKQIWTQSSILIWNKV